MEQQRDSRGDRRVRNVTFSGTAPMVHHDVNRRREEFAGIDAPFAVSAWREVTGGE